MPATLAYLRTPPYDASTSIRLFGLSQSKSRQGLIANNPSHYVDEQGTYSYFHRICMERIFFEEVEYI
ncbi:hypothetical protein J6TS2_10840 [Heyndrickxia sporothermodurans]|nr:hypothetical protein J6TS2_10840 [Heyndrickxia sporothermodurans]